MFKSLSYAIAIAFFLFFSFVMQAQAQNELEKDIIGTWKINIEATEKLSKEKNPELEDMPRYVKDIFKAMRFDFQKGGKCRIYSADEEAKLTSGGKGTWSVNHTVLSMKDAETGKVQKYNIIGADSLELSLELTLHDVSKNTYMVLQIALD